MRGVRSVVSKLAWIPVVAFIAGGCMPANDDAANLKLQSEMGWNAEKQLELKKEMAALNLVLDSLGIDKTARSYFAGFFTDGGS